MSAVVQEYAFFVNIDIEIAVASQLLVYILYTFVYKAYRCIFGHMPYFPLHLMPAVSGFVVQIMFGDDQYVKIAAVLVYDAVFGVFVLDPFIAGVGAKEYDHLRRHLSYDIVADSL